MLVFSRLIGCLARSPARSRTVVKPFFAPDVDQLGIGAWCQVSDRFVELSIRARARACCVSLGLVSGWFGLLAYMLVPIGTQLRILHNASF